MRSSRRVLRGASGGSVKKRQAFVFVSLCFLLSPFRGDSTALPEPSLGPCPWGLTASSLNLTQYDVEEVEQYCNGRFNHREIQCLYKRFRSLDKRHKGYISEDELLSIPELAISPLATRVVQVFQNLNFKDFVRLLAAFSDRASREEKLEFMFRVRLACGVVRVVGVFGFWGVVCLSLG